MILAAWKDSVMVKTIPAKYSYNHVIFLLRFFIQDADQDKELLLGHVSMILDMVREILSLSF